MTPQQNELLKFVYSPLWNMKIIETPFDNEMGAEREVDSMLNMPGAQPKCKTQKCEPTPINPGHRCDLNDLNKCNKSDAD